MILSELLTNALIHTTSPDVTIEITHTRHDELHLAVTDHSPVHPSPAGAPSPSEDESGRGLTLIAALAANWGTSTTTDGRGKMVWAQLNC